MRKMNVTFGCMAAVDHHLDRVARFDRYVPAGIREMRKRRDAIGLISDIDVHVRAGNLKYPAYYDFVAGRRRQMAVVLEKMLIFFRIHAAHRCVDGAGRDVFCQSRLLPWACETEVRSPRRSSACERPTILPPIESVCRNCQTRRSPPVS